MLETAIEAEVQSYLAAREQLVDETGHRVVVRNGRLPARNPDPAGRSAGPAAASAGPPARGGSGGVPVVDSAAVPAQDEVA